MIKWKRWCEEGVVNLVMAQLCHNTSMWWRPWSLAPGEHIFSYKTEKLQVSVYYCPSQFVTVKVHIRLVSNWDSELENKVAKIVLGRLNFWLHQLSSKEPWGQICVIVRCLFNSSNGIMCKMPCFYFYNTTFIGSETHYFWKRIGSVSAEELQIWNLISSNSPITGSGTQYDLLHVFR